MSVLKVMLLVSYLRRDEVRGRALHPADRALLAPMVRWSDSAAASRVRDIVGNAGLARLARRARMRHFHAAPIWGNSIVDASDQSRFMLHIERLVPRRHRRTALRLLGSIVRSQRWGIARVRPPGWALYFKSGWGSGSGAADHQVALLRRGGRRLSVAIMTTSNPSHAYAEETQRGVAARLLRGLGPSSMSARALSARLDYGAMDLTLSPSEETFRDELRSWLADNHPGEDPPGDDEAFEHRRAWQKQLHDAGYAGFSWPKEFGGRGATLVEQALFGEEMAHAKAPQPANVLGMVMGGPVVIAHGDETQKERFLRPILSGDEIWCQGFSEPDSGSDLASLKTRAVKSNGEWVVTGQKVWTTYAHKAKWCMLVARTDQDAPKHQGLTYFIMDMEQDAVQVRPLRQITGEAEFNELFIEEARIPDENVVGGVGNGWGVAITTLMHERAGLGASAAAGMRVALGELVDLARERGVTADPVIRQKIAQLTIEVELLRLNAWRGLTAIMKTGIPGPEGSVVKWQWGELNQSLTELAVDILGEDGALWDSAWTYRFLRSRANSIEGGTTEILKNIVAERVLGLPKLR